MEKLQKYEDYNESLKTFTVIIEWEHGDADTTITEKYPFKSSSEMDEFLSFIYDLRGPTKSKKSIYNDEFWYFEDGHNERMWSWVKKINKKYNNKFEDIIPSDVHYSQYRPSINKIWIKKGNKKHYIVWLELLHKQENIINLPTNGDEIFLDTGHVCWHHKIFKNINKQDVVFHSDLDEILGKATGKFPNITYPKFKVKVLDCKINNGILDYNHDFIKFGYELLTEIIDERLIGKVKKYAISHRDGFDPNFSEKFDHNKYDDIPYYEI